MGDDGERAGRIYALQPSGGGPVKIGWTSREPECRVAEIAAHWPCDLVLLGTIAGTPADERGAHDRLDGSRLRGEWFALTREVADWLEEHGMRAKKGNPWYEATLSERADEASKCVWDAQRFMLADLVDRANELAAAVQELQRQVRARDRRLTDATLARFGLARRDLGG